MRKLGLLLAAGAFMFMQSCVSISTEATMNTEKTNQVLDIDKLSRKTDLDTKMYPAAEKDTERVVIYLPELNNEYEYELELMVGKIADIDCNHHSLIGNFEEKTVEGWGYNYFTFESDGNMISTRMACPDNKTEKKLVNAQSIKTRYNSKLPVVVYVPKGYKVTYNVWGNLGKTYKAN